MGSQETEISIQNSRLRETGSGFVKGYGVYCSALAGAGFLAREQHKPRAGDGKDKQPNAD